MTTWLIRQRRRAAIPIVLALLLSACSSTSTPAPTDNWTAPAWFAQQARELEEQTAALQTCIDNLGWNIPVNFGGGTSHAFTDQAEMQRFVADSKSCRAQLGLPDYTVTPTAEQVRAEYPFQIDVWRCLRHEGYSLAEPPSEDSWVESVMQFLAGQGSAFWTAYQDPALASLSVAEREQLGLTCPQHLSSTW